MPLPSLQDLSDQMASRASLFLPSLTVVARTQRLNRENWTNLVNGDQLKPDYLIVEAGTRTPMPYAMDSEGYALPVSLYYVRRSVDGVVSQTYDRLQSLSTSLWSTPLPAFSLMNEEPTLDCTENNPANAVFYGLQAQLFAGMLSFTAYVGCGVYYDA